MKTILMYKDGQQSCFLFDGDALELDLDGESIQEIFSIAVYDANDKLIFSAYHWHNAPESL